MVDVANYRFRKKEGIVGVVGVAPYATVDFYEKLVRSTPAAKDWDHVHVLIDGNCKIPSRGRAIDLGEASPVPGIRNSIRLLAEWGADFAVVPCNTAHYFFEEFARESPIPVLNMIEQTARRLQFDNPNVSKCGLLASRITSENELYDKFLSPQGIQVITLPEEQDQIRSAIEAIKIGDVDERLIGDIGRLARILEDRGAEAIILGCTELSLVFSKIDCNVPVVDSNMEAARSAIERALGPELQRRLASEGANTKS